MEQFIVIPVNYYYEVMYSFSPRQAVKTSENIKYKLQRNGNMQIIYYTDRSKLKAQLKLEVTVK